MPARIIGDAAAAIVQQKQQQGLQSSPTQTDSTLAFVYSPITSASDTSSNGIPTLDNEQETLGAAHESTQETPPLAVKAASPSPPPASPALTPLPGLPFLGALNLSSHVMGAPPPDLSTRVNELDPLFQQARDKLFRVFDETVREVKQVVAERARNDKRRCEEWKASVVASYESASLVQHERVEKLSAEVNDVTKLLNDSIGNADALRADKDRLRDEIVTLKASRVHDSRSSLVGEVFAEGQGAQEEDKMTEAIVAASPELRVSSPMVAPSPLCLNTPSAPISTLARTPASRISLLSFHGDLSPLTMIRFSVEIPLAIVASPDPFPSETAALGYCVEEGRAAAFEGACMMTSNLAAASAAADAAVWGYLASASTERNDLVTAPPPSATAESGVVVADSAADEDLITIVSASDAASGEVTQRQTAITASPILHTEHPAFKSAVSPFKSPRFAEESPVARDTLPARAELGLERTSAPTGRSDATSASAMVASTAKVAPAAKVTSAMDQVSSSSPPPPTTTTVQGLQFTGRPCPKQTMVSPFFSAKTLTSMPPPSPRTPSNLAAKRPPMVFGTGARRSPLSSISGNSPHVPRTIDFPSTSDAAVSLGGRRKSVGDIGDRRSKAGAREGDGETRRKSVSARSISIGVGNGTAGSGGGGGIVLTEVREEAIVVAAIGNVEGGKVSRAVGSEGHRASGVTTATQHAGVGKGGVVKGQRGGTSSARASGGRSGGAGKPVVRKPMAGAAGKKIAERKSAGTAVAGKQKTSAGGRDDGVSSRPRSKAKATGGGGARGPSACSATRDAGTPSSTFNLRSRGAKTTKDGAGKRQQFFVFR